MAGLLHSLNVGSESLFVNRQGVDSTAHNIANAQTEGYSRQRVNVKARHPIQSHGHLIGAGSYNQAITRSHDQFIENQVNEATTKQGSSSTRHNVLKELEISFSPEIAENVIDQFGEFFSNLQTLSNYPEDMTSRTAVVESAKNLTSAVRTIDENIKRNRTDMNERLLQSAHESSSMLDEIAKLNTHIQEMEGGSNNNANDLRDQRDLLVRKLSQKMNIHYYEDKWGMVTVRGPGDSLLVEGGRSSKLDVEGNMKDSGMYRIKVFGFDGGEAGDITEKFKGGDMGALIRVRDGLAKDILHSNNLMAHTFTQKFNNVHREGYGLRQFSESTGRDFFDPITDVENAARLFNVSTGIANTLDSISVASTPNSPGDNVLANKMLRLKSMDMMGDGATLSEYYGTYVGNLGLEVQRAASLDEADGLLLGELTTLRESVSGVSLDEEAANMIKWQTAFTASSKVITTVDEMLETVLGLKR